MPLLSLSSDIAATIEQKLKSHGYTAVGNIESHIEMTDSSVEVVVPICISRPLETVGHYTPLTETYPDLQLLLDTVGSLGQAASVIHNVEAAQVMTPQPELSYSPRLKRPSSGRRGTGMMEKKVECL